MLSCGMYKKAIAKAKERLETNKLIPTKNYKGAARTN